MSVQATLTFPREFAFLPADSGVPWERPLVLADEAGAELPLASAVSRVVDRAEDVLQVLETQVITMAGLGDRLMPLSRATTDVYAQLQPELRALQDAVAAQAPVESLTPAFVAECADLPEGVVIDVVFRVVRVPALTMGQFAAQVAATCRGVLIDLPNVMLGIDEIIAVLRTVKTMFAGLGEHLSTLALRQARGERSDGSRQDAAAPLEAHPMSELWSAPNGDPDARTAQLASYRWLLGVHFFNLATVYCRDALLRARLAFERGDDEAGADALDVASVFLRGTTAAMWYSGNFSAGTYQRYIRTAIVRPGTSDGLSGGEMIDYKEMKAEKDRLAAALVARYGTKPDAWPAVVAAAARDFRATYIEDMEHHMRLASVRIGADTSLTQKIWMAELPADVTLKSAVEVLRDMAAMRRQAFPF